MNKPDVLNDEQIGKVLTIDFKETTGKDAKEYFSYVSENDRVIAQAQRDDTWQKAQAYYEKKIREIFEEIEELGKHRRRTSKHVVNYITINHKNWNALNDKYLKEKVK